MIPLMMMKGYRANGWLGLILGTRLYYSFAGAESDDEAAFEQRMEGLCREIGSRGQHQLSESVPPARAPAAARASARAARAPAPAPLPAPAAPAQLAATPERTFTPSMQGSVSQQQLAVASTGVAQASFSDIIVFMREERETTEAKMREQMKEMEAKLAEQRRELAPKEAISAEQVERLTARLEALHAAQLLSDEELFALEDCMADFIEAKGTVEVVTADTVNTVRAVGRVHKLISLSEGMPRDAMFARQLRRKLI